MRTLFVYAGICLASCGARLAGENFPQFALVTAARARAIAKSLEPSGHEHAVRERMHNAVVGVADGLLAEPT
jgi:hypothetical protein